MAKIMVTGGAGFIGSNYVKHALDLGLDVIIYDNFSRGMGCYYNIEWLKKHSKSKRKLTIFKEDIRDYEKLRKAMRDCDVVIHAAAQTSVPLSIENPQLYLDVNTKGTLNVLEAARTSNTDTIIINISSNKVYGIPQMKLIELEKRYDFAEHTKGIDEKHPITAQDPYGLSKIIGEQYTELYNKLYSLKTVNLRLSLTYGPRQWGTEAQGFVAWFCIAHVLKLPIRIFGNGKQVRDLLYIDDAISAIDLAIKNIEKISGTSINIGGGKENAISLLELIEYLYQISRAVIQIEFKTWRPHDVLCFYTNYEKAHHLLKWKPKVNWKDGIKRTYSWVIKNKNIISKLYYKKLK